MEVSHSAYYEWNQKPEAEEMQTPSPLEKCMTKLFEDHKQRLGSRRMRTELHKKGFVAGRFKVRRLMAKQGLIARYPRRFRVTTDSNHSEPIAPNILERQFEVHKPNKVWTTDVTYIWTLQGWMYLAVVMDLFNREIVGWSVDDHMKTSLCINALQMAYQRRKPTEGLVHHSDRGSQYASKEYRQQLGAMGMVASMSRKGNCWDNAPTERFFRSLKYEELNYERFRQKSEAKLCVLDYLAYYNSRRPHSMLGNISPMEYRGNYFKKAA